ncbi:MAG: GT4 family glycosyltransferase PelF [Chloroflexi bacterium]|nr:GT4 family glycosyltransferase PelF [Chloroflexota bacterium]
MTQPLSVLLTTEGSYPFSEGGVSTWCDVMIRQMPEIQFTLMPLVAQPGLRPFYALPPNVIGSIPVPLWGTGGVNELRPEIGALGLHRLRHSLTSQVMEHTFAPSFRMLLHELLDDQADLARLGESLRLLAQFFRQYDYDAAFHHPLTWKLFQEQVERCSLIFKEHMPENWPPCLLDVIEALRLLYRWLTPIALPLPPVDLIHASAAGLASLPGIIGKLEYGIPFLITEHGVYLRERYLAWIGTDLSPFSQLFATRITRRLVELSLLVADTISPVAKWNARWETRLGADPSKIVPISNGIDQNRFTPQPMPSPEVPTLVWVGRIDPLKDVLTLLRTSNLVKQALPRLKVLIFGKAPVGNEAYDASCRSLHKELGLEETVKFMGFAKSPQDAYIQGHVVVLSSISEALPFSVIEAMFCGRPVVGTDVGGVPEVIGQTGRVVMPRDAQAMAAACIELLSDFQLCQDLGVRAREHALANFTLQKSVDSYRHLYQELNRQSQRVKAAVPNRVKRLNPMAAQPKPQLAKLGAGKWATLSHWLLNTPAESMSGELYD